MEIRAAGRRDVADIVDVANASWHAGYDDVIGSDSVETIVADWYDADDLRAEIDHEATVFFVAEFDGALVGFSNAGPHPDDEQKRFLYRLYVHPDAWGEGIGTALLDAAVTAVADTDAVAVELAVLVENDRACGFYEANGFHRIETRETTLDDEVLEEAVYRKPL